MKKPTLPSWFTAVFLAGFLLRLVALAGHPFPSGDVNLFCLASDRIAENRTMTLPLKNHFTPEMLPFGSHEPQSQHQPLWPLLGGLLKSLLPGLDSYHLLQILSLLCGLAVILLVNTICRNRLPAWATFCATTLTAVHPLLVEYSANGSLYMLMAAQWLVFFLLLSQVPGAPLKLWIKLGILLGLSILTHFPQILMLPVLLLDAVRQRRRMPLPGLLLSLTITLLIWLPWGIRNQVLFGSPLFSSTILNFKSKWGLLETGLLDGRLVQYPLPLTTDRQWMHVLRAWPWNTWQFLRNILFSTLFWPLLVLLLSLGCQLRKKQGRAAWVAPTTLALLYLAQVSLWGFIRPRFIVPLLPLVFLGTGFGLAVLEQQSAGKRIHFPLIIPILTLASLLVLFLFQPGHPFRQENLDEHNQSRHLAAWLKMSEPGIVLGYATRLDGGIESIRNHEMPYIHGRNFLFQPDATVQLLREYQPKYIWCDEKTLPFLQQIASVTLLKREGYLFIVTPNR